MSLEHRSPSMYLHTQRSRAIVIFMSILALVPIALLASGAVSRAPLGTRIILVVVLLVLLASGAAFSALTISVGDGRLAWWFRHGVYRKSVLLADVVAAEPTTTTIIEGWGIHLTARGWLYNVAGRRAVLVTLRDGTRFMLGTDEPERLADAIRSHLTTPRRAAGA